MLWKPLDWQSVLSRCWECLQREPWRRNQIPRCSKRYFVGDDQIDVSLSSRRRRESGRQPALGVTALLSPMTTCQIGFKTAQV